MPDDLVICPAVNKKEHWLSTFIPRQQLAGTVSLQKLHSRNQQTAQPEKNTNNHSLNLDAMMYYALLK
jgi:hypothetical protein